MIRINRWAFVILLLSATPSHAEYIIMVSQSDGNVVATGSGSLNLSALSLSTTASPVQAVMDPADARIEVGTPLSQINFLSPLGKSPKNFGNGPLLEASTSSGDFAGVFGANAEIEVSKNYVSGTTISGSATWNNTTISGLGMIPGTYLWTWGSEAGPDSLEVIISSPAAVPEPPSLILGCTAIGVVGFGAWIHRRQVVAVPA
jgi:hypothetical protein